MKRIENNTQKHMNYLKKTTINIHNTLINATQNLTLPEKRLIMLAISKITFISQNKKKLIPPIQIEALEFSTIYKIEPNTAYEQMKEACENLIKKQVYWFEETAEEIEKISINWVSSARYAKRKGVIQICFTQEIQKYIIYLKKHFTTYYLHQAISFKSIHSWRLLELISQFKKTKWREININEFTLIMEATEKQKKDFFNIRRGIIEPSVKELNEKTNLEINWKPIKKGKKVNSLIFKFEYLK